MHDVLCNNSMSIFHPVCTGPQAPQPLNILAVRPGNTLVYSGRGKEFPLSYTTCVANGGALDYKACMYVRMYVCMYVCMYVAS